MSVRMVKATDGATVKLMTGTIVKDIMRTCGDRWDGMLVYDGTGTRDAGQRVEFDESSIVGMVEPNPAERIRDELEALEPMRQAIKARSMRYQADLKDRVAEALGVTPESLDLPYEEWAAIRDDYLKDV